jgi:hypothetical protein
MVLNPSRILIVMVDTQTYTCDKIVCNRSHKYTHTHKHWFIQVSLGKWENLNKVGGFCIFILHDFFGSLVVLGFTTENTNILLII